MSNEKPGLPRGTRDFSPEVMVKRSYIIDHIKKIFERYGFLPLETPALENLSVLTGKYGEEGDQLLFKILNSGNYLDGITREDLNTTNSRSLAFKITEKGLRYDLTVPFARFVVMNQNDIAFPFKRYQVQPVWRADRPQKGRYREFYQCDADVVGTNSLICEAEIILMVQEVFKALGIEGYTLKISSRKILDGLTEVLGIPDRTVEFFTLLDKLDKIGKEKLLAEFSKAGFTDGFISSIGPILHPSSGTESTLKQLADVLSVSDKGMEGIHDIRKTLAYCQQLGVNFSNLQLDPALARGLSYYTGIIFEVKVRQVIIGSIGGGGRYDNLTGVFGLPGISGVGFSFGIDRIYDVMDELSLFPSRQERSTQLLIANFGHEAEEFALGIITRFRNAGINTEVYPDNEKIKKQLNYANKKQIPYVLFIGAEELKAGKFPLKDMISGNQELLTIDEALQKLQLRG
jgi:histidyl-tRNA synthetase